MEEGWSRGSGKGGQNRHKTASRVTLRYKPMELVVHCSTDRRRTARPVRSSLSAALRFPA